MDKDLKSNSSCDSLFNNLKHCAHHKSAESLDDSYTDTVDNDNFLCDYFKMFASNDETLTITANGSIDDNILEAGGRISLAYENLKSIPKRIAEKFSSEAKFLDLSYNSFRNLSFLSHFQGLHTLILDRNIDLDESTLPYLSSLKILWINNCNIANIANWIYRIQTQCPSIEQLSMMGNPGAKTLLNGGTASDHTDYRMFVFRVLPNLLYLDGVSRFTPEVDERPLDEDPIYAGDDGSYGYQFETSNNFRRFFRFRKRQASYQSSSTS